MKIAKSVCLFSVLSFAFSAQSFVLPQEQAKHFRAWVVTIVEDQISQGANPRWTHQDCAGLLRFAVNEAFARHDDRWRKANGFIGRPLPPELKVSADQIAYLKKWKGSDGQRSAFVRALPLIQENAVFLGKSTEYLEAGDLLFFDQGDDQHLMIWTGKRIVYHTGRRPRPGEKLKDNGLRALPLSELSKWSDSRWQPRPDNPNFIGFYRLSFLHPQVEQGNL